MKGGELNKDSNSGELLQFNTKFISVLWKCEVRPGSQWIILIAGIPTGTQEMDFSLYITLWLFGFLSPSHVNSTGQEGFTIDSSVASKED